MKLEIWHNFFFIPMLNRYIITFWFRDNIYCSFIFEITHLVRIWINRRMKIDDLLIENILFWRFHNFVPFKELSFVHDSEYVSVQFSVNEGLRFPIFGPIIRLKLQSKEFSNRSISRHFFILLDGILRQLNEFILFMIFIIHVTIFSFHIFRIYDKRRFENSCFGNGGHEFYWERNDYRNSKAKCEIKFVWIYETSVFS